MISGLVSEIQTDRTSTFPRISGARKNALIFNLLAYPFEEQRRIFMMPRWEKERRQGSWNNIFTMWRRRKKSFKAMDTNIDRKMENLQRLKKVREDLMLCQSRVSRKTARSQGQPDLHSDPVWLRALCLTHVSHHSCSVPMTTSY